MGNSSDSWGECVHGEIHPSVCIECLEAPPPEKAKTIAEHSIVANRDGRCEGCGKEIYEAVTVIYVDDSGKWKCGACVRPKGEEDGW